MAQVVAQQTTGGVGSLGTNSVAVSFGSLPSAGSAIIVATSEWVGSLGTASMSDNQGNTYTQRAVSTQGGTARASIWIAENIGTPSGTFTVTYTHNNGASTEGAVRAIEVTGNAASSSFDVSATNGAASSSDPATCTSGTTASTAQADEIAVAAMLVDSWTTPVGIAQPSGWSDVYWNENGSTAACRANYKILTATGTQSASWGSSIALGGGTGRWVGAIATFKAAAAGGNPAPGAGTVTLSGQSSPMDFRLTPRMA